MNYTGKELDDIVSRHRSEDRAAALWGIGSALFLGACAGALIVFMFKAGVA